MYKSRKKSDVLFAGIFVILGMWMILSVHCRAAEKNNDEKQSQIVRIGSFEDTFDYIDKNGVRRGSEDISSMVLHHRSDHIRLPLQAVWLLR